MTISNIEKKIDKKFKVKPNEYLVYVMGQMGIRQSDLFKKGLGCRSHISEFVNGKRKLSLSFIKKFLKVTNRFDSVISWQILTQ